MEELSLSQKEKLFKDINYANHEPYQYKICAFPLQSNAYQDCYREQVVSFFQMAPLMNKTVPLQEADYILYANPYARVEDFTDSVLKELEVIDAYRKPGAEIIVCGKAANIESQIEGKYDSITFVLGHYAEYIGKRFGFDFKEQYVVYDDRLHQLDIWPVDGCLNQCGFCRRCYMEIPFESQSLEFLKERLDWFQKNHPEQMKNVSLRAENLTQYGIDLYGKPMLHQVIDLIDHYDEVKSISFPIGMCIGEITEDILMSLCSSRKIKSIGLNLETGSDRLLQLIGKKHTCESAKQIIQTLVKYHPNLFISSTVMLGLPTEEISDILSLGQLIIDCKIDYLHCNYYGFSPKHPLAQYEQVNERVRELHLAYLIQYLKKNYNRPSLFKMRHERIEDTSKRSVVRELEKIKEQQKHVKPRILRIQYEYFFGHEIVVKSKDRTLSGEELKKELKRVVKQKRLS